MTDSLPPIVARVFAARPDGSRDFMGEREFAAMPSANDRILMPALSPDGVDPYRVLFVEHRPGPFPRSDRADPPTAAVIVEAL
jgi:hypothetical protein